MRWLALEGVRRTRGALSAKTGGAIIGGVGDRGLGLLSLLLPALILFALVLVGAVLTLLFTSFLTYVPGSMGLRGSVRFTSDNYLELIRSPAYFGYLLATLRIALAASVVGVVLSYPLALVATMSERRAVRRGILFVLIGSFFLNGVARVYSWILILGEGGVLNSLLERGFGTSLVLLNTEVAVVIGLIHFLIPLAALSLMASFGNIDVSVLESAASLGANEIQTFFRVTLPISLPGLISAFSLSFALGVSAFVVPMLLGGGIIMMMANLIYSRFSEIANYPSGGALAIVLLVASFGVAYGVDYALSRRVRWLRRGA